MPIYVHRRKLASEWTSANVVLNDGEIAVERDSGRIKVGDGSTAWNSLPYAAITQAAGDTRYVLATARGAANGVAPLNSSGKIDSAYLGPLRIATVTTVANQAARLALPVDDDAQFVVQSDTAAAYMLAGGADPSVAGNWIQLPQPSVAGLEQTANKNQANGYAGLDSNGKINPAQIPTIDGNV